MQSCLVWLQDPLYWASLFPGMISGSSLLRKYVYCLLWFQWLVSGSSVIRKYIAWYAFRILFHKTWYPWVPDVAPDFVPDFVHDFVGVLECVSAPSGKHKYKYGSQNKMTSTARSTSKFCARDRPQSPNSFDRVLASFVIPGHVEPLTEGRP